MEDLTAYEAMIKSFAGWTVKTLQLDSSYFQDLVQDGWVLFFKLKLLKNQKGIKHFKSLFYSSLKNQQIDFFREYIKDPLEASYFERTLSNICQFDLNQITFETLSPITKQFLQLCFNPPKRILPKAQLGRSLNKGRGNKIPFPYLILDYMKVPPGFMHNRAKSRKLLDSIIEELREKCIN